MYVDYSKDLTEIDRIADKSFMTILSEKEVYALLKVHRFRVNGKVIYSIKSIKSYDMIDTIEVYDRKNRKYDTVKFSVEYDNGKSENYMSYWGIVV